MFAGRALLWPVTLLALLVISNNLFKITPQTNIDKTLPEAALNKQMPSKAQLVKELSFWKERIEQIEETKGQSGAAGFKVYSPDETAVLLNYYKKLRTGLEYLDKGRINDIKDWEGYPLIAKDRAAYDSQAILEILRDQAEDGLPPVLLTGFKVYLLPVGFPEISGLGRAGFALIGAPEHNDKSLEQLQVTLLHELGHHLHSRFMPFTAGLPSPLWRKYLEIRGGEWHKAGPVNSSAWSDSSEETFAEDFRLLFGKNQSYYGDLSLGDPRDHRETAHRLRQFILGLKNRPGNGELKSPWLPDRLNFWLNSQSYIFLGWAVIFSGIALRAKYFDKFTPPSFSA
ncbi:MAG: hypothetical protein GXY86_07510 [Firmicutes bacterium]|nr:hypothetical protein [Bacillota bacterium]